MRRVFAIALIQFRITLKSKPALVAMFAMPLALILIFGVLLGGLLGGGDSSAPAARVYDVALVDEDHSLASALLAEALGQEKSLSVRTATRPELNKLIADSKISAGFVISEGFQSAITKGQAPALELVTAPGSNMEMGIAPPIQRSVNQLAGDFYLAVQLTGGTNEAQVRAAMTRITGVRTGKGAVVTAQPMVRESAQGPATEVSMLNHSALGFTVMSVMMSILMMAGTFLLERQNGTWGRVLTTPTGRVSLLAGYMCSFFVTGLFQFTVLVFGTRLLFHINWGPLLPLFAVGAATVLAAAGLGLCLAGLVKTFEQQTAVGVIFVIATSMLGGLFWPLEILSPAMQRIGHFTPQAWAMDGLTEVALRGGSWGALALPLTVLLSLAVIFSAAGVMRVKYE